MQPITLAGREASHLAPEHSLALSPSLLDSILDEHDNLLTRVLAQPIAPRPKVPAPPALPFGSGVASALARVRASLAPRPLYSADTLYGSRLAFEHTDRWHAEHSHHILELHPPERWQPYCVSDSAREAEAYAAVFAELAPLPPSRGDRWRCAECKREGCRLGLQERF